MDEESLAQKVDQAIEVTGTARDAMAGAVVLTEDRTPVYIDGLQSWDDSLSGSEVSVSGTLRRRGVAPEAQVDQDGAVSHGMSGPTFVLENASWRKGAA